MYKFLLLIGLVAFTSLSAQVKNDISFASTTHNFGKIKQNSPVTYVFTFTNNMSKPAVIEFVNADCGCTTPEYSKDPILKGKSSKIKVTYDAATMGTFKKNINIKFVHAQMPFVLTINGEVIPAGKSSGK